MIANYVLCYSVIRVLLIVGGKSGPWRATRSKDLKLLLHRAIHPTTQDEATYVRQLPAKTGNDLSWTSGGQSIVLLLHGLVN